MRLRCQKQIVTKTSLFADVFEARVPQLATRTEGGAPPSRAAAAGIVRQFYGSRFPLFDTYASNTGLAFLMYISLSNALYLILSQNPVHFSDLLLQMPSCFRKLGA